MGIPEYPLRATCGEHGEYRQTKTQQTFDIQDLDNYIMINHVVAKKVNKQTENSSNSRLVVRLCPNNIRETVSKNEACTDLPQGINKSPIEKGLVPKVI